MHPEHVLPHQLEGDLDDMFPKAEKLPETEELQEPEDGLETRGVAIGRGAAREDSDVHGVEASADVDV